MKEISEHIYNTLKVYPSIRILTGKSLDPYGVYRQSPPVDIDPPFIILKYSGGSIDIFSGRGSLNTTDYILTFFGNNYEDLKLITFIALTNQTVNTYKTYVDIKSLQMVFEGPVILDPDFNTYKQSVTYRAQWMSEY